jgi:hypothetical protein
LFKTVFSRIYNSNSIYEKITLFFILPAILFAQEATTTSNQVSTILTSLVRCTIYATPNMFRNAAGAPGPAYYQQADYKIDIELDDKNAKLNGSETVTY